MPGYARQRGSTVRPAVYIVRTLARRLRRQREAHRRALRPGIRDPDTPPVLRDEPPRDSQPQPRPAVLVTGPVRGLPEGFKHRLTLFRRDAWPLVGHIHAHDAVFRPRRNADAGALGRIAGGIVHQVADHLPYPPAVH